MGRIKTALIKRKTKELVETYHGKLTSDYEENKKILHELNLLFTPSKKLRNIIAGYATRLMQTRDTI